MKVAIERLQAFADMALQLHPAGYQLCDSGGKDSQAIIQLAYMAQVPFEIVHNHTTADHPETVYFVREEKARWEAMGIRYTISYPTYKGERTSMWKMIPIKGPPTRLRRWCCSIFKETSGHNRFCVTGVRWAESVKRKNNRGAYEVIGKGSPIIKLNNDNDFRRRMTESCQRQGKRIVNPIIDWPTETVWDFIKWRQAPYNPLYDRGYLRIGCIGCPCGNNALELEKHPQYKTMYLNAFDRYLATLDLEHREYEKKWESKEDIYNWWISSKGDHFDPDQTIMEDYVEKGEDVE